MSTPDIAKFSSPDQTRIRDIPQTRQPRHGGQTQRGGIPTGLPRLDAALSLPAGPGSGLLSPLGRDHHRLFKRGFGSQSQGHASATMKGVRRGEVTEIMGPRGSGKTALAMNMAANVLHNGERAVWIDTAGPMNPSRFTDILQKKHSHSPAPSPTSQTQEPSPTATIAIPTLLATKFTRLHASSLAHLLALLSHPPPNFPPTDTSLIVVDTISSPFSSELRTMLPSQSFNNIRDTPTTSSRKLHNRRLRHRDELRWKLINQLLTSLKKLATRLNCAIVVVNELASRFRQGKRPMLHESLSGVTWEAGVAARIVLYYHWLVASGGGDVAIMGGRERMRRVRVAEVVRSRGTVHVSRSTGRIVPFVIRKSGPHEFLNGNFTLRIPSSSRRTMNHLHIHHTHTPRPVKRKQPPDHQDQDHQQDPIHNATNSESQFKKLQRVVFSDYVKSEVEENDHDDDDDINDILLPIIALDEGDDDDDDGAQNHDNAALAPTTTDLPAQTSRQSPSVLGSFDDDTELLLQNISSDEEFG
ncbi:hypothetical protein AJ80_07719 [Polytolypa hystricis UAMH7299]|uniref:AAA+ ATPase domain-containing protein n=1 Tax=Polytolypa hystricis (strain UAMH7299) TaxID=1447883 RepID=A0A2B7XKR1_POLH7|nr:hypothetical protein AJ80_07719 [Polytolypa hystricis UAMH7299]